MKASITWPLKMISGKERACIVQLFTLQERLSPEQSPLKSLLQRYIDSL